MPAPPSPPAEFDEFYVATRRRLMLTTFALTGDLGATRSAVRDAYVAARHHWRKVSRSGNPEDWVRPRAWSTAQRRSTGRIWHRPKGLSVEQKHVLEALQRLPDSQRKTLLLANLASMSMAEIGREVGLTRARAEAALQQATSSVALGLDCDSTSLRGRLELLGPFVASHGLPRASAIRRSGRQRQRLHFVGGAAIAVLLTLAAGAFVAPQGQHHTAPALKRPVAKAVTSAMLLDAGAVTQVAPHQRWHLVGTDNNTAGSGINTVCQAARFADPRGLGTWVRRFRAAGPPARALVQTVELSASPGAAMQAYRTTLGWYAGCEEDRVQIVRAYRVSGIGDQAQALKLRVPGPPQGSYVVAVARSGALTTTTVLRTGGSHLQNVTPLLRTMTDSMRRLCASSAVTECRAGTPAVAPVLPPPSGEATGMLAVADLPSVGRIAKPWVGTDPEPAVPNLASTTCDRADFVKGGSAHPRTRTFLIPQAKLPSRFGITETYGGFGSRSEANAFVAMVRSKMAHCEKKQLGSTIVKHLDRRRSWHGSTYSLWRLKVELDKTHDVVYWMGIARVGSYVAQLSFAPTEGNDIDEGTFHDLVARARDRLFELS